MDRYGTDLSFPADPDAELVVTPTGDIPSIGGKENFLAAQRRGALVVPGSLVHRPDFGGGLRGEVGRIGDIATRARISSQVRRNALRDNRAAEATCTVSPPSAGASYFLVELVVREAGDDVGSTIVIAE